MMEDIPFSAIMKSPECKKETCKLIEGKYIEKEVER